MIEWIIKSVWHKKNGNTILLLSDLGGVGCLG